MLLIFVGINSAVAQGTAFTYNGRLNNNGAPVNGAYDLRFTIFDANVAGNLIGNPVMVGAVPVVNGLFAVQIDFGPGIFTGPARWLNIEVQAAGGGGFTPLTPRQEATSSPYSIRAQSAGSVANSSVVANQLNTGGVAPTPGQFLSYNGGNLFWSDPAVAAGNIWSRNGADTYYNAGNVGVGTITPTPGVRLEVNGPAKVTAGGSGGFFQIGTPNGETGLGVIGVNRFDLRFNGSALKLVAGPGVGPPPAEYGISISTNGYVGIGKASPLFKLDVLSDNSTAIVGRSTVVSGVGVYGESAEFNGVRGVGNNVNHGAVVGVHNNGGIGVLGQSSGVGVFGNSLGGGAGVFGESAQFEGVRGLAHNAGHGGVVGVHDGGGIAVYGTGATGVQGDSTSAGGYGGFFRNTAGGIALGVQGTARVSVLQITGGADVAEPFTMPEEIAKGSVVVIDDEHPGQLKLSTEAYDKRVAGIVSGANGINPGIALKQEGALESGQNVALSGRVYVRADASFGAIRPGDMLTTSATPGHAMRVSDHFHAQGAILGKAMSGLNEGRGMVLVLVTLQ